MGSKYVLAIYDIRGKQEFIYRSNRIKEIIGASVIIRDCFEDYLYPVAETIGAKKGIFHQDEPFTKAAFEKHIEEGYLGEVVYEGGGNFLLLYKDEETFKEITYLFTKKILEEVGTLRVLGTCISDVDFENYKGDQKRLYEMHRKNEGMESNISPWGTLPIVQVDRRTYMPLVDIINTQANISEKVSKESKAKYKAYQKECAIQGSTMGETVLDKLVHKKGEESLLAIIYIDGNNMGAQVQACHENKSSYEDCVAALRSFSKKVQKDYIDDRKIVIDQVLQEKYPQNKKISRQRLILGAGDEINFICNARDALDCVRAYMDSLPEGCSSCAGIAVFHSHAPYAEAYRMAEECCESGKKLMKEKEINHACFVDFHYCQGAIGISLEDIRRIEHTSESSRPWLLKTDEGEKTAEVTDFSQIEYVKKLLNTMGRSNVKTLFQAAKTDKIQYQLELQRISAHMGIDAILELNDKRRLVYDMGIAYDIWFSEK
ncbi:MAG: hypothetical protein IKM28_00685 [Lachnospiraceae bacterium]|nr:hypothetical protein [Lachnospiraceae bacterium]